MLGRPGDLQVDAFLDFDQSNGKSVVFVTDRAYQPGEQVLGRDLQILNCFWLYFHRLLLVNELLLACIVQ